jgi:hypothetical protein
MTLPLILQIQEAALDGKSSVTDALRKARIACAKLGLTEFGNWVDKELNGYMNVSASELPEYRKLYGRPEAYNRYQGWQPIQFSSGEQQMNWSLAPIGMAISAIEDSLPRDMASGNGIFSFPYSPEFQVKMRANMNWADDLRIRLEVPQILTLINSVRNILLDWTIDLEKQGVLGESLTFSSDDREKSAAVTANTVNNIHIEQVGSFVQSAQDSVMQGSVETTMTLSQSTLDLVQQVEALLPASNLPAPVQSEAQDALSELKQAANSPNPESGRLRKGLESLKRVLAPAGETLLKIAVDTAVKRLLGQG